MNRTNNKPKFTGKPKNAIPITKGAGVYVTNTVVHTQAYPLTIAMEKIQAQLSGFVVEREKPLREVQGGAVSSLQEVIVTRNDAPTTLGAMKKRIDVVPQEHVAAPFKAGYEYLMSVTPGQKQVVLDDALMERWLITLAPAKEEECRKVLQDNIFWQGCQDREVFAKPEILLKPEGAFARLIHNGNPVVACIMGAMTNELQGRAALILSERNPKFREVDGLAILFPCGKDDKEIAELRARTHQGQGRILEGDFSSNDATQPPECRKLEAMWYRKLGAPDWYVRATLELVDMKVFSRSLGLKAKVHGQRHSGEEAGTIGNEFVSVCQTVGSLVTQGIRGATVIAYGDDTEVWVPARSLTKSSIATIGNTMAEHIADSGMIYEVGMPTKQAATFLQTRVYETQGGEAVPMPKMGRYLAKLNVRANNNPDIPDNEYYAGKYLGLAHQWRYFPSISRRLLQTSQALSTTPRIEMRHTAWKPVRDPGILAEGVLDVKRPLDPVDEAMAFHQVYNLDMTDILGTVDLFCASALVNAARDTRYDNVRRNVYQSIVKARPHGFTLLGDIDTPAMAQMVRTDNRDVISVDGKLPDA